MWLTKIALLKTIISTFRIHLQAILPVFFFFFLLSSIFLHVNWKNVCCLKHSKIDYERKWATAVLCKNACGFISRPRSSDVWCAILPPTSLLPVWEKSRWQHGKRSSTNSTQMLYQIKHFFFKNKTKPCLYINKYRFGKQQQKVCNAGEFKIGRLIL